MTRQAVRGRVLLIGLAVVAAAACGQTASTTATRSAPPAGTTQVARPTGHPSATPSGTNSCADRTLAAMSEPERVGQLFALGIAADRLSASESAAIAGYHLGSTWLENTRSGGVVTVRKLSDEIQALATDANTGGVGFLIGADQEGGLVQRLRGPGFSTIPSAVEQGQLPTANLQNDASTWGSELAAAGINLDLGPVMDVVPAAIESVNQPIGVLHREFGGDPATVGSHGAAVVRGMSQARVATTLKHFPGLGRVAGNTDLVSGVTDSVTTADDPYLEAFRAGIEAGAPFVMISLVTYTAIDPGRQAVFSPAIVEALLRGRLGFGGVVVSDDLGATAAVSSISPGDRAIQFVAAGGDLIIVSGAGAAAQMAAAVVARDRSDPAFAGVVDDAALYVLRAKQALGLLPCR